MSSIYPWEEDYDPSIDPFLKAKALREKEKTEEEVEKYYVVRPNFGDVSPNDDGVSFDFVILEDTQSNLKALGYVDKAIYKSELEAIIYGALLEGYFDEFLDDVLSKCNAYRDYRKRTMEKVE